MEKQVAIFDLDGTLLDAYAAVTDTLNHGLERLGYKKISLETVKRAVGWGDKNLAGKLVSEQDIPRLISLYRENHTRFLSGKIRLLEGSLELLTFLKRKGIKLGVATNRAGFSVDELLGRLNIKQYFDIICTTDDVKNPKPHPEMLFKIMDFLKVSDKNKVFYVGDMNVDYFTGRDAGVDTYIVLTGSSLKEDLEKLEDIRLFDNLVMLTRYLKDKL